MRRDAGVGGRPGFDWAGGVYSGRVVGVLYDAAWWICRVATVMGVALEGGWTSIAGGRADRTEDASGFRDSLRVGTVDVAEQWVLTATSLLVDTAEAEVSDMCIACRGGLGSGRRGLVLGGVGGRMGGECL